MGDRVPVVCCASDSSFPHWRPCSLDADGFDTLARSLTDPAPRRHVLGTLLAGIIAALGLTHAEAKKKGKGNKKKGKKRKNKDKPSRDPSDATTTPTCSALNCSGCC